jgi:hypothetical protein
MAIEHNALKSVYVKKEQAAREALVDQKRTDKIPNKSVSICEVKDVGDSDWFWIRNSGHLL